MYYERSRHSGYNKSKINTSSNTPTRLLLAEESEFNWFN